MSAPDRRPASTTATACARPATIRFRAGKRQGAGGVPGQYSETSSPRSPMRAASSRLRRGYGTSTPDPSTATVAPPAASAPSWAAASIPCARPLTTTAPRAASSPARARASARPADVARRLPTIATAGPSASRAIAPGTSPRRKSAKGGS